MVKDKRKREKTRRPAQLSAINVCKCDIFLLDLQRETLKRNKTAEGQHKTLRAKQSDLNVTLLI